ncbi:MerR family transcriptional regulator [Pseudonocardia acaciae]|uniref:MerR family transcriptional regulator n=1 Tax=Pseudonocardia acaciae TaxID=551276 RepID=UPI00048FE0F4|nr:MerR family transcriptional regulator [Pseudonocardia acaciae]
MGLLTIGAFARASRLSPKALRRYDELGLLRPAHVDPHNGYRRYAPEQVEHARLVAWLRRLGMPLARIKVVCALPPARAADEVAAYWREVEADTEARRELAEFLVHHLSGKDEPMAPTQLTLRYAATTDRGLVRDQNQDAAWADHGLLAVADGFGAAADTADTAIRALATRTSGSPGALLDALRAAAQDAADAVRQAVNEDEAGTTLTALAWSDSELALVHVGDSRAYLLRDGELLQLTHDDTLVQHLIDEGKLTAEEAESHPQRAILVRALHGAATEPPDVRTHQARPGDRYLLCSDGLHGVLSPTAIRDALTTHREPDTAVRGLVELVHSAGAPDNVACVVADVL